MSLVHHYLNRDCESVLAGAEHGVSSPAPAEASAVLHPPAGTSSDRFSLTGEDEKISQLARLMAPVGEPGEEGYDDDDLGSARWDDDDDQEDDDDATEEHPAYSQEPINHESPHPLHTEFLQLSAEHLDACDLHLSAICFQDGNVEELGRKADALWARLCELKAVLDAAQAQAAK